MPSPRTSMGRSGFPLAPEVSRRISTHLRWNSGAVALDGDDTRSFIRCDVDGAFVDEPLVLRGLDSVERILEH
jgi:hypothetical protein